MIRLLRYPGGKQRLVPQISSHLPCSEDIQGRLIEPFAGSAAVFFSLRPRQAQLGDTNSDLMHFYMGIKAAPDQVWLHYVSYGAGRDEYYRVRAMDTASLDLPAKAARVLYLSRTCFKGMWRHNLRGQFNIGYGGEDRRWMISLDHINAASRLLAHAELSVTDFEPLIDAATPGDFIFIDPPYRPGAAELANDHYGHGRFGCEEHHRLAGALERASRRRVRWAMTTSAHPKVSSLYKSYNSVPLALGTGSRPGSLTSETGEILIRNY